MPKYVSEPMSVSLDRKYLHVGPPANCAHPGVIPFHTRVRQSSSQATARALAAPRCATKLFLFYDISHFGATWLFRDGKPYLKRRDIPSPPAKDIRHCADVATSATVPQTKSMRAEGATFSCRPRTPALTYI